MADIQSPSSHSEASELLVRADPLATGPPPPPTAPPAFQDTSMEASDSGVFEARASGNPVVTAGCTTQDTPSPRSIVAGAGVGSGVLGLLVGGPFLGLLLGFGGAYAAENKEGHLVGDTAQAVGEVALSIRAKARVIDDKHKVVEQSQRAAAQVWTKAQQLDREQILDKTKDWALYSWNSTVMYIQRHNLVERGVVGMGTGVFWLMEKVMSSSSSGSTFATLRRYPSSTPRENALAQSVTTQPPAYERS